jgi:hypothetical protein
MTRQQGGNMSTRPKSTTAAAAPPSSTPTDMLDITIASNQIAANARDVNPYEIRNSLFVEEEKARVEYKNGVTVPTSAKMLLANAERKGYNHRRTLSRNIVAATSQSRPSNACAHHIVALRDPEAGLSRNLLFRWGIGINDADNGVFLPRNGTGLPGNPSAAHHTPHHSVTYHLKVYRTLNAEQDAAGGRSGLRSIKADLLSGALSL